MEVKKTSNWFNEKYKDYIEGKHYGLDIDEEEVVEYLDKIFEDLIKIPGFQYSQIKLKFGSCRFYSNISHNLSYSIEDRINKIIKHIDSKDEPTVKVEESQVKAPIILYNAIKTPDGTVLWSKHRHDFVVHIDKNGKTYGVDGGRDYLKRIGDIKDCEDLSVNDDGTFETRRQYLFWGQNYDKEMKLLPETKWVSIKELTTDHIEAILRTQSQISSLYKETMEEELKYRAL